MASELLKTRLLFFFTTLRLPRRGKLTTSTYLAILGIGIIAIVTIVVTLILQRSRAGPRFTVYPLPSLEATKSKPFLPDYKYWNLSSSHSASAWDVLGRHGDVLIPSSDLDGYGLPRGLETSVDGYDGFPLSAFHQLHCLKSIRKHYVALQSNTPIVDSVDNHVDHCFDYLRQAIMCSADMTLEKARVDPDGHRRRVDGWGTMHKCRDWGRVREIVEERRQI
ncbi:hypothetical protein QBC34DRAFT_498378 [Podospora aff. communis PSN243]|uniref:Oxidase n=1 Tax=Podospora aff. communis PSN243 TaxID=3040156 RepID=A0AAV9G858_9PEZI|nr:hypothetical protein QBC34DRAFT_498378 [Podospora aff. communis PSN243]